VAAWALSFIPALGVPGLYDEKTDLWDWKRRRLRVLWGFPRYWLSALARWPITLLRNSLPADSQILSFVDGIDNQLAFFQMQIKGVSAGVQAAEFLNGLMRELEMEKLPRVHLIGHSFGGLLVANAARTLANQDHEPITTTRVIAGNSSWGKIESISTVCLLQGALASNWFDQEEKIRNFVRNGNIPGRIAAIYSGYDTANGFYYPMANSSRMGAGYVGMYRAGDDKTVVESLGKNGEFASLVKPPCLDVTSPPAISLDASRIIYEGPAATGGGHGDIFKDDVVNLLWAITNP
jgi:pimeloyl-ACP methyl ester carboxylesterase